MGHFKTVEWADWVRGVATDTARAAMDAHLTKGCAKCSRTVEFLRKLAVAAAGEAQYQAPEELVVDALSIFTGPPRAKAFSVERIRVRLVYDSFSNPLPAGVRARRATTRHALYQAGDYSLHLSLEPERGTDDVSLVGQIASHKEPRERVAQLPVLILSGKEIVGRAVSNNFGEFQLQYRPARRLRLQVQAHQDSRIEVSLGRFYAEADTKRGNGQSGSDSNER
jgi:hypothetical protein